MADLEQLKQKYDPVIATIEGYAEFGRSWSRWIWTGNSFI
jgi:hypothetical protein